VVPIGRFEVPINLIIHSPKSFKFLKIWFESSTVALTNLTAFGVAVGLLYLRLNLNLKIDTNYLNIYIEL
jgi:hypothetical protein